MASYTTAARVQALCPRLPVFSSTTTVTADEVDTLIADHEAEVEVALAFHGYTTPVTSPAALVTWLGKVVTEGVAGAVLKAWYQDATGPNSEAAWAVWEKRYQAALKQIREGNFVPAATDESGGRGIASWTDDYATSTDVLETEAQPTFKRTMEW